MRWLFGVSMLLVVYTYALYPLLLWALTRLRARDARKGPALASVTMIVAARNEADKIRRKLEHSLALDYPADRLEILVASDASDDGTDDIVREYAGRGVRLVRAPERKGKEHAQGLALAAATGEIVVMTDAATLLEPEALRALVANFSDPSIGAVSSEDVILDAAGNPTAEGVYVKYEMWVRRLESRFHSLVGLSGSCFAIRKELCSRWPATLASDFMAALHAARAGYRAVADASARGRFIAATSAQAEMRRKVRTFLRGITVLMANLDLLNPFRYGRFAFQLASHKLLRFVAPLLLLTALTASGLGFYLVDSTLQGLFVLQMGFYVFSLASGRVRFLQRYAIIRAAHFFTIVQWAMLMAWGKYVLGQQQTTWEPTQRQELTPEVVPQPRETRGTSRSVGYSMPRRRVIVLDGEQPASLAIVRSLGRRGIDVLVGSSRPGALATRSRYASRAFVYPHPLGAAAEFRKALLDVVRGRWVDLTIPAGESTCVALAAGRDEFHGHSRLALSSNEALAIVLSRAGTRGLAGRLGIPTAPGIEVRSVAAGLEAAREMGFPLVVAPDNRVGPAAVAPAGGAQYAVDRTDLVRALNPIVRIGAAYLGRPLRGDGIGLAVLCRRGSVLWAFQCRRLHELGPGDGVSAYRISEAVDPTLLAQAQKVMWELSWEGAAELQFRRSDGEYCLTNVSATFADALPVAVAAGADAPSFLYDLEVHDREDFGAGYRIGARCRHLPSEIVWTRELARPKTVRWMSSGRPKTPRVLADMARALSPWEHWDTQSVSDPGPGVQELREVSTDLWRSVTYRLARIRQRRRMRRTARHTSEIATRVLAARTILFVCLGNIIRSAFAAGLLGVHSAGRPDLRIRSAGLDAATDHTADPTAVQCARRFGVDLSTHRTRRIDRSAVEEADILLAMELDHVVEICRRFPQYRHKVYLFGCLNDENAPDVADPVYAPEEVFDACFDRIDRGVRRLVEMRNPASQLMNVTRGVRS